MIGQRLSPILAELENTIWESEVHNPLPPEYTLAGFRGALKICMSAIMDKMWDLQEAENMALADREAMAERCGNDFRKLVKIYTGIDSTKLYEK